VRSALERFEEGTWSRAKPSFRREVLFRVADLIEARSQEIAVLQSLEMGAPIGPARSGPHPLVARSAWNFRFFAQEQELAGNRSFNRDDTLLTYTMSDAAGCLRADHAVECAVHAVDLEDRAVHRLWQFRCTQAFGALSSVDARDVRNL